MYVLYENQPIKVPAGFTYTSDQLREKPFYAPLFASQCCLSVNKAGYTMSFTQLDKLEAECEGLDFTGKSDKEKVDMINKYKQEQEEKQREEQATLDERVEANAAAIEELASAIFAE